jgi:phosphoribosylamine---glycine ligase
MLGADDAALQRPAAGPLAAHEGILRQVDLRWWPDPALCPVLAAKDYPDTPPTGGVIRGLDRAGADPAVKIFHTATRHDDSELILEGGCVLGVTALGADLGEARCRGYRETVSQAC